MIAETVPQEVLRLGEDRKEWPRVRFGEVVRNVNDVEREPLANGIERFVGLEHLDPESLQIRRWGLVADGTTFTRRFRPGQVLFGKRRAYQRKAALAEWDGICSGDILVFEVTGNHLLPELLPFTVQTDAFVEHALSTSAGSLSPRTRWSDLERFEFALPPLEEQRRIAEVLRAADDACNHAGKVVDTLQSVRSAWFESIVANGLRESEDGHGAWLPVPLRELWTQSPSSGFSAHPVDRETGVYVLALSSLTAEGYRSGELKSVEDQADVRASRLQKGDFLVSRSNTIDRVGFAGVFDETRHDVSYPDTMMRLAVNEERVHKRFLERVMLSAYGRSYMRSIAAGTSSSMKKINRTGLGALTIPLPSLALQDTLVAHDQQLLRAIDAAKERHLSVCSLRKRLVDSLIQHELPGDAVDV